MPLVFSPEQVAFREAVRSFLAARSPEDEVRRLMATDAGYDPAVWAQLNEQLGAAGLAVPEEYGGSGYTFRELAIVLEEAGRSLLCAPLLSSVLASSRPARGPGPAGRSGPAARHRAGLRHRHRGLHPRGPGLGRPGRHRLGRCRRR